MSTTSMGANSSLLEGERVHFMREDDLEAVLRYGYLELRLVGDHGITNRVIRYQAESSSYLWYEASEGVQPKAIQKKTYASLSSLTEEVDMHAYRWYPLYPLRQVQPNHLSPFNYHSLLDSGQIPLAGNDRGGKAI